ncbi:RiPP maturation radical SAM C-methyltransferase [Streptomyces sp. SPB162]|uniref:RiPP maturation radical SAM C-methyltransferase n=1 Tax=Streptomyces sp. SPB162 TaxID=2940560 RepID=UPI002406CC1E|nr:RiPP maturation radical SAM C-methyltransferase [Streptomyces sp. SPB162]MDF9815293.1 ribosomal peptide maturation radical SAM protein 1 [Streptomyces sp. SPB162]
MLRVAFVNMPFADWNRPSFALSQLAGLIGNEYADRATAEVHYLNVDFTRYFGVRAYEELSGDMTHLYSGVGEWLFRHIAFPDEPDNSDSYFSRYYREPNWKPFRDDLMRRREGIEVFLAELIDRYQLASADVVGLTTMFAQTVPTIALARMIKERNPEAIILLGGSNVETSMGAVLAGEVPYLDYVFSGPSLVSFGAFLDHLLSEGDTTAFSARGVITRDNCTDPQVRFGVGRDRDINDYVPLHYDDFAVTMRDAEDALAEGELEPTLFFETSRGCWWGARSHCTFCGLNDETIGFRQMDPDLAVSQFEWLFSLHPQFKNYMCTDYILPRNYAADVFPRIDAPDDASIFYEIKLPMSETNMQTLATARVNRVQAGIEAVNSEVLKLLGKGTTAFQSLQFMKLCLKFGIHPEWNLLIGAPREPEDMYAKYERDFPILAHLTPPTGAFFIRFDRFSPYFNERLDYGLDLRPMDFYPLVFPFDAAQLDQLAYFFADHGPAPYAMNALKWYPALQRVVADWQAGWKEAGDKPRLELVEEDGGQVVKDTRFGPEQRIPVDGTMLHLLQELNAPRRPDQLTAPDGASPDDVAERLALLQRHRALFEEDGRLLSLVTGVDATGAAGFARQKSGAAQGRG